MTDTVPVNMFELEPDWAVPPCGAINSSTARGRSTAGLLNLPRSTLWLRDAAPRCKTAPRCIASQRSAGANQILVLTILVIIKPDLPVGLLAEQRRRFLRRGCGSGRGLSQHSAACAPLQRAAVSDAPPRARAQTVSRYTHRGRGRGGGGEGCDARVLRLLAPARARTAYDARPGPVRRRSVRARHRRVLRPRTQRAGVRMAHTGP